MIGLQTSIGSRPHWVTLEDPSTPVSDGDSGLVVPDWTNLVPPSVYAEIKPATARDLERLAVDTTVTTATHVVSFGYHPQVTTNTRIVFGSRILAVTGVSNPDERGVETVCVCVEQRAA
jgi:head-tail adaptor